MALRRLLVSPEFLFRVETAPDGISADAPYRIQDLSLASRLSFFLWSSIPDEELLVAAESGTLSDPAELTRQVERMLADPRSKAVTENFAGQWLQLRNLATTVRPGDPFSLAFGEALRQGLQRETELFFDSVVRDNRSAVELLTANYTFLNERVAGHYGIPNVQGNHFRRVTLPPDSPRRGLLGHGSILDAHIARDPHIASAPREMGTGQRPGHAATRATSERARPRGPEDPGQGGDDA